MPALSDAKTKRMPLSADAILRGVRQVDRTHDGREIGHVEKLESDRALRLAISRRVNFIKHGLNLPPAVKHKIGQAQRASITKRAKGKREAVRG